MHKFFYSPFEKIAFYISGYSILHNEYDVKKITASLELDRKKIIDALKLDNDAVVKTFEIKDSRFYKGMRVFYIEEIEENPKGFFNITDWTMDKWCSN